MVPLGPKNRKEKNSQDHIILGSAAARSNPFCNLPVAKAPVYVSWRKELRLRHLCKAPFKIVNNDHDKNKNQKSNTCHGF